VLEVGCSVCSSGLGSGGVLANKRLDGAGVPVVSGPDG
jgi:hypothetical protein